MPESYFEKKVKKTNFFYTNRIALICGFSFFIVELSLIKLYDYSLFFRFSSALVCIGIFSVAIGSAIVQVLPFKKNHYILIASFLMTLSLPLYNLCLNFHIRGASHIPVIVYFGIYPLCLFISITSAFASQMVEQKNPLHFFIVELVGAILGLVTWIFLFQTLGPLGLISLLGILFLIGSFDFRELSLVKKYILCTITALAGFIFYLNFTLSYEIKPFFYKRVKTADTNPQSKIYTLWTTAGHFNIYKHQKSATSFHADYDSGLLRTDFAKFDDNLKKTNESLIAHKGLFWNSSVTLPYLLTASRSSNRAGSKQTLSTFIIGGVGGQEARAALHFDFGQIKISDIARPLYQIATHELGRDIGALYRKAQVSFYPYDGRYTIEHLNEKFNVIQLYSVYAGSSVSANYGGSEVSTLYTTEAIKSYIGKLKPAGLLAITTRQYSRTLNIICESSNQNEFDFFKKVIVISPEPFNDNMVTLIYSPTDFTMEQYEKIKEWIHVDQRVILSPFQNQPPSFYNSCFHRDLITTPLNLNSPTDAQPLHRQILNLFSSPTQSELGSPYFTTTILEQIGYSDPFFGLRLDWANIIYPILLILFVLMARFSMKSRFPQQTPSSPRSTFVSFNCGLILFSIQTATVYSLNKFWGEPDIVFLTVLFAFLLGASSAAYLTLHFKNKFFKVYPWATLGVLVLVYFLCFHTTIDLLPWSKLFRISSIFFISFSLSIILGLGFPQIFQTFKPKNHELLDIWFFYALGSLFSYSYFNFIISLFGYHFLWFSLIIPVLMNYKILLRHHHNHGGAADQNFSQLIEG